MAEFIDVHNPTTGGRARVTEDALERLWKHRGWRRGTPSEPDEGESGEGEVTETEDDLSRLRKPELIDRAASQGLEVDESMTKDQLVAAIRGE